MQSGGASIHNAAEGKRGRRGTYRGHRESACDEQPRTSRTTQVQLVLSPSPSMCLQSCWQRRCRLAPKRKQQPRRLLMWTLVLLRASLLPPVPVPPLGSKRGLGLLQREWWQCRCWCAVLLTTKAAVCTALESYCAAVPVSASSHTQPYRRYQDVYDVLETGIGKLLVTATLCSIA